MSWKVAGFVMLMCMVITAMATAADISLKAVYYDVPSQTVGTEITAHAVIYSPVAGQKELMFEIVQDNSFGRDEVVGTIYKTINLTAGDNDVSVKFPAPWIGKYFVRVYYWDGSQWVRIDPWQILSFGRPGIEILSDVPAIEDSRTVTSFPYTITDTVTYKIRYDTPYGGPVYFDRYMIQMKAGKTYNITIEVLNDNPVDIFFFKDDGKPIWKGYFLYYSFEYTPSKDYTAELRIHPKGSTTNDIIEVAKYKLTIREIASLPTPTPTPTPSIEPVATPTASQTPSPGVPGFEAVFAVFGLLTSALLLRRKS